MKFNLTWTVNVNSNDILAIVNDYQSWNDFEEFSDIAEIPIELIIIALNDMYYFEAERLDFDDVDITVINEEN